MDELELALKHTNSLIDALIANDVKEALSNIALHIQNGIDAVKEKEKSNNV